MIEYQDIENTVIEKGNMGGAWENVYFAPKSDFSEFATRPPESGNRSFPTMNKLTVGQDRLKPGKKLFTAYSTMEKVSLKGQRQGEVDGMSHKNVLNLFNPGLTSEALGLLLIPNQNWIFYVRTGEQMFRVGGEQFAAKLAAEGEVGTGDTTASLKGNAMTFQTYDVGFCPEVVDIAAILAMRNAIDDGLTVAFVPSHGAVNVLIDANPTVTFAEAVVNSDTLLAFTNQEIQAALTLEQLDVDGNKVADKAFTAVIAGNVVTVTPTSDFIASTLYKLKFDASKVLSADAKGRVNGSNYVIFVTA